MTDQGSIRLHTLLGEYPGTLALKRGEVRSSGIALDFADVEMPHTAFKRVVREIEFDVAELAALPKGRGRRRSRASASGLRAGSPADAPSRCRE